MKTFKINYYLSLKLEKGITNIYVKNIRFKQCKYLAFNIPKNRFQEYDNIKSIDDMEQHDRSQDYKELQITPKQEFQAHCSNLQAWYEHGYDTRLLHRNLAFPLLKYLTKSGDRQAKRVFKDEIGLRFEEGNDVVKLFLIKEKYLDFLNELELEAFKDIWHGFSYTLKNQFETYLNKRHLEWATKLSREKTIHLILEGKFRYDVAFNYVSYLRGFSYSQLKRIIEAYKKNTFVIPDKKKFKRIFFEKKRQWKEQFQYYKKLDFWLYPNAIED